MKFSVLHYWKKPETLINKCFFWQKGFSQKTKNMPKHEQKHMEHDPLIHHRRSIRLKDYDYSQPGAYFVTLVAQGRANLFGEIQNEKMVLNAAGDIIQPVWQ